ncbi:conjugal transfer protein TrbE [Variovorax sp. LARHSF232]
MLNLAEYRRRPALLADWLPWAGLVAPGVVLNKDGSFQRTARFRGPDLDSATQGELVATSARLNNALRRLGSGWALFVEAERCEAAGYPASSFPEPLSWLIDEERRAAFEEDASHFESRYHLTLLYLPPEESKARAAGLLYENAGMNGQMNGGMEGQGGAGGSGGSNGTHWQGRLEAFVCETERFLGLLEGVMPELAWLDDAQTLTYLHGCVSTRRHAVAVPEVPMHLDALLADEPLTGGLAPMLGRLHLRVLSVRGFPTSTWPGLLDDLNRLGFAYRWSTRFLCLDKAEAQKELVRLRRQWFAKRKNIVALLRETLFQQESPLVDSDASNKAADADAALQELGSDQVAFGYVTATVTVLDAEAAAADEKLRAIERTIQGRGFVTIPETLNAVEAWLSSIPGHPYANVRQPIVSTLNLAHMMPVSAVWAGPERNAHLNGPPLIVTRTDGATQFRLVTHIGDVGHTLVVGPTGMGKSVLLATLALQFRRYAGSRILAFDMGRSMRATILGLGGEHYELGSDGAIAFQPLARIDQEGYLSWAAEWVEGRLLQEGVAVGPPEKAAVWSALNSLASAPVEQRTMTGLSVLLQSNALRQALQPYVLGGAHGRLLDADVDRLGSASVQGFEMEDLMHSKAAVLAVLGYLFARFDERFDGAPTLLILDEAWLFLDDPVFAARIRQWLKTLRKKNVSVIFATQSLADIQGSSIAPAIVESCASRIFLPNPQATEPQIRVIYEGFGLNGRQIEIVATAQPKRDYYYQSRLGNRVFELGLGPAALAFAGASSPQDQRAIDAVCASVPTFGFAAAWLRHCGLDWAADLIASFPTPFPSISATPQEESP